MLQCKVCRKNFNIGHNSSHADRTPKLLKCGHTLCFACLRKQNQNHRGHVVCSFCQVITETPNGLTSIQQFATNEAISFELMEKETVVPGDPEILDFLRDHSTTNSKSQHESRRSSSSSAAGSFDSKIHALCKQCEWKPAYWNCIQCSVAFCPGCFEKLHQNPALREHKRQHISSVSSELSATSMCTVHPRESLGYYCEDCNVYICPKCVIFGAHKAHNVSNIEEKVAEELEKLSPGIEEKKLELKLLKYSLMIHGSFKEIPLEIPERLRNQIHEDFVDLRGMLQLREEEVLRSVQNTLRKLKDEQDNVKQTLINEIQLRTSLLKEVKMLEKDPSTVDSVTLQGLATAFQEQRVCHLSITGNVRPVIEFSVPDNILQTIRSLGELTTNRGSYQLHSLQDMKDSGVNVNDIVDDFTLLRAPSETCGNDALDGLEEEEVLKEVELEAKPSRIIIDPPTLSYDPAAGMKCENVIVTHITNPSDFYIQKLHGPLQSELQRLQLEIFNYTRTVSIGLAAVELGDFVIAPYSLDKKFYRGQVRSIESDDTNSTRKCRVFFVDYGNSEVVPLSKLRKIPQRFPKLSACAINCALVDIVPPDQSDTWPKHSTSLFSEIVSNKKLMMSVQKCSDRKIYVDLHQSGCSEIPDDIPLSVRDALVFLDCACFLSTASVPLNVAPNVVSPRQFFNLTPLDVAAEYDIVVSHVESPSCFYVQRVSDTAYIKELWDSMEVKYKADKKNALTVYYPQKGMLVGAKYSDGQWYRAVVTRVSMETKQHATICYVDFGNTETVHYYRLRKLPDEFRKFPKFAIKCSLTDVAPLAVDYSDSGLVEWTKEASHAVEDLRTMDPETNAMRHVIMNIVGHDVEANLYCVVLYEQVANLSKRNINSMLVQNGFAQATGVYGREETLAPPPEDARIPPLSTDDLLELSSRIQLDSNDLPHTANQERAAGRARVSPAQSPPKSKPTESPSRTVNNILDSLNNDTGPIPPVPVEADVDTTAVPTIPTKDDVKTESTKKSLNKAVYISHVVSPGEFYVQNPAAADDLKRLMDDMREFYTNTESQHIQYDCRQHCAALHSKEKDFWFRASVQERVQSGVIKVQAIDYGFYDTVQVENVRYLEPQFRSDESFACKAFMIDIIPAGGTGWSGVSCDLAKELMEDKILYRDSDHLIPVVEPDSDEVGLVLCIGTEVPSAFGPSELRETSLADAFLDQGLARRSGKISHKSQPNSSLTSPNVISPQPTFALAPTLNTKHSATSSNKAITGNLPKWLPATELDESVLELNIIATWVDYDCVIYVQPEEKADKIQKIVQTLTERYNRTFPDAFECQLCLGQAVVAQYSQDGLWYRGVIKEIHAEKGIGIQFVDFGNSEYVMADKIRTNLSNGMINIPRQSIECELFNLKPAGNAERWPVPVLNWIHEEIVGRTSHMLIKDRPLIKDERLKINLIIDGKDISNLLLSTGLAHIDNPALASTADIIASQNAVQEQYAGGSAANSKSRVMAEIPPDPQPLPFTSAYEAHALPRRGEYFISTITHVEPLNRICFQVARLGSGSLVRDDDDLEFSVEENLMDDFQRQLDDLVSLTTEINHIGNSLPSLEDIEIGLPCIALFPTDDCWYRAEILESVGSDMWKIRYVDFGNSDVVPTSSLRELPAKYLKLPKQSMEGRLAGVGKPVNYEWTTDDSGAMLLCMGKAVYLFIKTLDPLVVQVYCELPLAGAAAKFPYQPLIDNGIITMIHS